MLERFKIIPVAVFASAEEAKIKLGALEKGGLPVAEICFRTECAEECIRLARKNFPAMCVGAGTVING